MERQPLTLAAPALHGGHNGHLGHEEDGSLVRVCRAADSIAALDGAGPHPKKVSASGAYDDNGTRTESVNVVLEDVLAGVVNLTATSFVVPSFNVMSQLQADGLLRVLLQVGSDNQGNNDFYFQSASLVAMWETRPVQEVAPTQPAPEPVELALFGIALSAFAFRLRRKS